MDRKERILSYIKSKEYIPLRLDELMTVLDVPSEDREELEKILSELCSEGKIAISKRGRYTAVSSDFGSAAGTLQCNGKGYFGFLICDDGEDIFIAGVDMADALDGDKVLARISDKPNTRGHYEGRVIRVLERGNVTIVGVIYKEKNGYLCLRPDNRRIYTKILIAPENASNAQLGDRASVSSLRYENGNVYGTVIAVLGGEDSLKGVTDGIIISHGIKSEFDEETLREADKISQTVSKKQLDGREDLRDKLIFTIDGDDARDFDDAVSVETLDNGNYLLGVHIADVSEYVKENTALDSEALERGTSVYLADRVIPMLPESLSNGICSLNPNVDRLTLSCFMEIDKNGGIANNRLAQTVIRSKERMTYNNVNKLLEGGTRKLAERYEYLLPTLKTMEGLAEILRNKRIKRGAIQFDFPESRVVLDENGEPSDIVKEIRGTSNKMIEEFMLAANETVAEFAYWSELPFVYRSHEPPAIDKIKAFNQLIMRFGLQLKGKIDEDNPIKPKALQKVLDDIAGDAGERIVANEMLHSLMKAKYTPDNLGHFGLAAKYYCHFTSPIRRYPDLVVHRILKKTIDGTLSEARGLQAFTAKAATASSEAEIEAELTEREVDDLMKTAYMSKFVGEAFDGIIANVTGFGMFVELDNTVQGLVRLENMTGDYYEYDESAGKITGRRTGTVYEPGGGVRVTLARADIMSRQIDFVLEQDATEYIMKKFKQPTAQPKETKKPKRKTGKTYKRKKR